MILLLIFAPNRSEHPSVVYANFRDLIASGKYGEIYGDIPKRPLFLGMLVEDAWSGKEPARHLHRLYGTYFRNKFELDRISVGAAGAQNRPSEIVARVGRDQAVELLINLMQEAADRMLEIVVSGDTTTAVHRDTISETDLREISNELGLPYVQVEDIVMHSLLQPSGRDRQTGHRSFRFAHRSFQDWFLARQFAAKRREPYFGLPPLALAFLDAMRNDLNLGKALP